MGVFCLQLDARAGNAMNEKFFINALRTRAGVVGAVGKIPAF